MRKVQILAISVLIAFVFMPTLGKSSFILIEVDAAKMDVPELEAGDLSDVLDSLLDNITAEIAPAAGIGGGAALQAAETPRTVHVGKVLVRSSTFKYNVRDWIDEIDQAAFPVLHNAQPAFLQAYFQTAKALGTYSLKSMSAIHASVIAGGGASVLSTETLSALNTLMGTNDTAEATGYNDDFTESYSIDDLEADNETPFNATQLLDYAPVEEVYQQFANFTESNETVTGLLGDDKATDDIRMKTVVSGFDNIQEAVYEILEASIAANYSTPGDQIDPERVSILEADNDNNNKTTYMKQNFVDRVRAVVNNEFFEAEATLTILGIRFSSRRMVVPASAFFSLRGLSRGFGRIIKMGKTIVSAPFRAASTIAGKIKRAVIDKPIAAIRGTISKGLNMGRSLIHKAIAAPGNIVKTIGGTASNFVQKAAVAVTPMVSGAGKLLTKGLSAVGGFAKSFLSYLPILVFIIITVVVIGAIVYFIMRPRPPTPA